MDHIHRTTTPTGAVELLQINLHSFDRIFNYRNSICLHTLNIKDKEIYLEIILFKGVPDNLKMFLLRIHLTFKTQTCKTTLKHEQKLRWSTQMCP